MTVLFAELGSASSFAEFHCATRCHHLLIVLLCLFGVDDYAQLIRILAGSYTVNIKWILSVVLESDD